MCSDVPELNKKQIEERNKDKSIVAGGSHVEFYI